MVGGNAEWLAGCVCYADVSLYLTCSLSLCRYGHRYHSAGVAVLKNKNNGQFVIFFKMRRGGRRGGCVGSRIKASFPGDLFWNTVTSVPLHLLPRPRPLCWTLFPWAGNLMTFFPLCASRLFSSCLIDCCWCWCCCSGWYYIFTSLRFDVPLLLLSVDDLQTAAADASEL